MIPRVPPKGAGEVRYNLLFYCYLSANSYCGNTSSVFFITLGGDEKSTFPKGEGIGCSRTRAYNQGPSFPGGFFFTQILHESVEKLTMVL